MVEHPIQWVTASPLWSRATNGPDPSPLRRPALLRLTSDSFMTDLQTRLSTDPASLFELEAKPESFRARPLGETDAWTPPPPTQLKLYQPFHGHFNLIAASLVCGLPGLPDRVIDRARQETASFVLRRLSNGSELAWVNDPAQGKGWRVQTDGSLLDPFEERLPLFPVNYLVNGRKRRLLAGLIPTSSVDALNAAPSLSPSQVASAEADPRIAEIDARVFDTLRALLNAQVPEAQARAASLFLLLDLADFLARKEPSLWTTIQNGPRPAPGVRGRDLYTRLESWRIAHDSTSTTWLDAVRQVFNQRQSLVVDGTTTPELPYNLKATLVFVVGPPQVLASGHIDALRADLLSALGPPAADTSLTLPAARLEQGNDVLYVARCVFERPRCSPFQLPTVSDPSTPFSLATVFDFDAPARPIRIVLPIDTSPAGLRKFPKNVAVVLSDQLRRQMNAASDMQKLLKGDASGGGFDLGMICSFSIPIITLCAFIVMIIFQILLNIIFWWLPFFRICWPIPKPSKPT